MVSVLLAASKPACAQDTAPAPCSGSAAQCGRQAFEAGIQAFERGDFARALELFEQAQTNKPHPVILFNVALAEAELGRIVQAAEHLRIVFEDPETPATLLDRVRTERSKVEGKVARVTIDDDAARLVVDGQEAEGRPPQMRVDPGQHQIRIVTQGRPAVDRTVTLGPGEHLRLAVAELATARPSPVAAPRPEPPPPSPRQARVGSASGPEPEPGWRIDPVWVYVGGGLTAVLGGLTLWSALETQARFSSFEEDVGNLSSDEARERIDDGEQLETLTNGLIIATATVGAATTAAFFLVDWGAERRDARAMQGLPSSKARRGRSSSGPGVALVVTPGTVHLTGRF